MNISPKYLRFLLAGLTLLLGQFAYATPCGNDNNGGDSEDCDDCDEAAQQCSGSNPFHAYTGNVTRVSEDLKVFGSVGEQPLNWVRENNSRMTGGSLSPFGHGGNWRHPYQWEVVHVSGSASSGNRQIQVYEAGGKAYFFKEQGSGSNLWLPAANVKRKIVQSGSNFEMLYKDGRKFHFTNVSGNLYQPAGLEDALGNYTTFTYDVNGNLVSVTDASGRSLTINYQQVILDRDDKTSIGVIFPKGAGVWSTKTFNTPVTKRYFTYETNKNCRVAELEFYDENDNLLSGTIISSIPTSGHEATLAFDGDPATYFRNITRANGFVGVDFGAAVSVAKIRVLFDYTEGGVDKGNAYSFDIAPTAVTVIASVATDDGRTVSYDYSQYTDANPDVPLSYLTLTKATFPDGEEAHYTYMQSYPVTQPLVQTAIDPRGESDVTQIEYTYNMSEAAPLGLLEEERDLVTGEVLARLTSVGFRSPVVEWPNGSEQRYDMIQGSGGNLGFYRDKEGSATYFEYTAGGAGFLSRVTDALGRVTLYGPHDSLGNPLQKQHPDGTVETWTRDAFGHPLTHTISGPGITPRTKTWTRDSLSRPTRIDYPDSTFEEFTYNTYGQVLTHTHQNGGVTAHTYDASGLRLTTTDPLGHTTTYTYHDGTGSSPAGLLATETNARVFTTSYDYNDRGQVTQITHPDATFISHSYDVYGNRVATTNELGDTTTYLYNQFNQMVSMTDPLNRTTEYSYGGLGGAIGCGCNTTSNPGMITLPSGRIIKKEYDLEWKLISETDGFGTPDAATTTYAYDAVDNRISTTNPLGQTWTTTYDSRDRRSSVTDPLSQVTTWTYDAEGNVLTVTKPGSATTTYAYDVMNRRIQQTDPLGGITLMAYDASGNMTSMEDALGRTTTYTYDIGNRLTAITHPDASIISYTYDANDNRITMTDELNRTTQYDYDNRDRLVVVVNPLNEQIDYGYDAVGRQTILMLPGGQETHSVYDSAGQMTSVIDAPGTAIEATTQYTYDVDGNQATVTDPAGHTTTFAYNGRGERISTTTALGLVTAQTLDLNGNSIQTTRPDSSIITRTYDALNRLLTETDAASDTIAYTYTARGPLATITDSRGAVTAFQYDLKDRLTAKVYDDTSSETSAYNTKDQLTVFTTARGITRTYTYDNRDRLTGVSYSDATPAVSFTYNAAGERLSANNAVAAVAHSYDAAGRKISETHNITGHPLGARTLNLQHDVDSRLTRITYPDASQVDYGYDQRGRLASVTGAAFSVAYTRSLDNLVTGMSFSNGITSSRVFDADHRLLDIAYSQGSTVLSKAAYDLNLLGQRTRVERANGLGDNFSYDAKDQVVAADYESAAPATAGLGSSAFTYDAMGNRTALSQQLVGGTLQNETYTANLLNQYTAIGSDAPVHDADGNLTSQGGAVLTYDGENRVTSITPALPVNGDQRLSYSYDALGRRVAKAVETYQSGAWLPSTQTNYLYWGWNVLEEHRSVVVGAVSTHRYIWGEDLSGTFQGAGGVGGMLLQEVTGGTHAGARWFSHYDGNGNITELSDNAGNVVASYRYAVFGETMSATGPAATANIYRFSTKPLDAELASNSHTTFSQGLYYYGYRFYDPENGRWLNRDPIGERGELNLYGMVENNPINYFDRLGLFADEVTKEAFDIRTSSTGGLDDVEGGEELIEEFLDTVDDPDDPDESNTDTSSTCKYSGRAQRAGCQTRCFYRCSWGRTHEDVDGPIDPNPCESSINDPHG